MCHVDFRLAAREIRTSQSVNAHRLRRSTGTTNCHRLRRQQTTVCATEHPQSLLECWRNSRSCNSIEAIRRQRLNQECEFAPYHCALSTGVALGDALFLFLIRRRLLRVRIRVGRHFNAEADFLEIRGSPCHHFVSNMDASSVRQVHVFQSCLITSESPIMVSKLTGNARFTLATVRTKCNKQSVSTRQRSDRPNSECGVNGIGRFVSLCQVPNASPAPERTCWYVADRPCNRGVSASRNVPTVPLRWRRPV